MTAAALTRGRAAAVLLGVLLIGSNLRAGITSVGPVLGDVTSDLGLPSAAAGVLVSLPVIAFAVFSPVAPALARRLGVESALWSALIVLAAAIIARSLPIVGAIWVGTAFMGAAIALLNVLLPSLVKRDFPNRVSTLTGAYSITQATVAALASGFAVPIAGVGQEGWRLALGLWAGLAIVAIAAVAPQLRRGARLRAQAPAPVGASRPHGLPWRSGLAWQVTLFMGLQSFVFYVMVSWLPSIEQGVGVSSAAAGWHLFYFQMVSVVAMVVTPPAMRRLRSQSGVGVVGSLFALAGLLGLLLAPRLLLLWVTCLGLSAGGMILLALSLFGLRTRDHGRTAALSGMAQTVGYLLAAAGPIAMGALHDATGGWTVPLIVLATVAVFETVFAGLAGRDRYVD